MPRLLSRPLARPSARGVLGVLVAVLVWLAVAVPVALLVFTRSTRSIALAGHDAVVRPSLDGWARIDLGPFLPGFRYPTGSRVGADIELGKTTLESYGQLFERYAFIASQPAGQIARVEEAVRDMAVVALLAGAVAGLALPLLWLLLGSRRRRELVATPRAALTTGIGATLAGGLVVTLVLVPGDRGLGTSSPDDSAWRPIAEALPDVTIPDQARPLQVDSGLLTQGTQRLVESAFDSYRTSSEFYTRAAEAAAGLGEQLRQPREGETVAVLVSDRHDNIGMDPVARAVADAAGATFLLDAGDDTSTGSSWEAFSLESLHEAFSDFEHRFFVAGNHDHGTFITEQADELGFTTLDGEVEEGPDGIRLLGVDDPRSSGLGNWRDETGLSFAEVTERITETACAAHEAGERVSTIVVHDRNNGAEALARGCVDLVVSGHLHVIVGPEQVTGENGEIGYAYTTGTTGGAAYAIAIGTKPRRDATVSLVTYREGRPVGIQWVQVSPLGAHTVGPYTPLTRRPASVGPADETADDRADDTAKGAARR